MSLQIELVTSSWVICYSTESENNKSRERVRNPPADVKDIKIMRTLQRVLDEDLDKECVSYKFRSKL